MKDTCNMESATTNECKHNSYTPKKVLAKNPSGYRIDHIFIRSADTIKTTIMEYKLPLPDRVPGQKYSYSDHEAVQVRLLLEDKQEGDTCSIRHVNACVDGEENEDDDMHDVHLTPPQTPTLNGKTHPSDGGSKEEEVCPTNETIPKTALPKKLAIIKESIDLCEEHLKKMKTDRVVYFTISLLLLAALIVMAEFPVPNGYKTLYLLLKLVVFGVILFCTFMGSIWNLMERNGTLSGKTSMEMKLTSSQSMAQLKND